MEEFEEIVVVGASLAGLRAVEALRREGYGGQLALVGDEPHFPPYDRPPLSKEVLTGAWDPERARLRVVEGLEVELVLGRSAVGFDPSAGRLELDDGSVRSFDGAVIATGAIPRMLPFIDPGLDGVFVLRSFEESIALRSAFEAGPEVVVIGAGWIGAEVAAACRARGLSVTVLEALDVPMIRALGPELGGWAANLHRSQGVDLRLGVGIAGITEVGGQIASVILADGTEIPAEVLVVAVGVEPATGWLDGSGLVLDNGVVCDETCRALGADRVVAAGDVARWFNPLFGRDVRVEHWANAVEQADASVRTLLAGAEAAVPFASVPYFWSDQYGNKIQYVGIVGEFAGVVEGALDEERFVAAFTSGDQLVGALCLNSPGRMIRYRRLISNVVGLDAIAEIAPGRS